MGSRAPASTVSPKTGVKVLVKAMGILNLLGEGTKQEFTLGEISASQGINKATCHNILFTLVSGGYVEKASPGSYRLGIKAFQVGSSVMERLDVRRTVYPIMEELRASTGETVFLYLRRDDTAVCIEKLEGRYSSSHLARIGTSMPLHVGAAPKILLAERPDSEVRAYFDRVATQQNTNVDVEDLLSQINSIRKVGIAHSVGDVEHNTDAVGAPVYDHNSQLVAALSISWLVNELLTPTIDLAAELKNASRRASLALGSTR